MTHPLWIVLAVLAGGLYVLGRWARRQAHDPWVYTLWYLALGPRTDAPDMTRRELFESAAAFLTWTLLAVLALELVLLASPQDAPPWVQGLAFGLGLLLLMGVFGAGYMLLRGLRRRRAYLSHERFSAELGLMPFWIHRRDWAALDAHFRGFAARTCGPCLADAIVAVDLDDYRHALADALCRAVGAAAAHCPAVIAYLHRPHEEWSGAFCVYEHSSAAADVDQRRMRTCVAEVPGPPCADLARIFLAERRVERRRPLPRCAHRGGARSVSGRAARRRHRRMHGVRRRWRLAVVARAAARRRRGAAIARGRRHAVNATETGEFHSTNAGTRWSSSRPSNAR